MKRLQIILICAMLLISSGCTAQAPETQETQGNVFTTVSESKAETKSETTTAVSETSAEVTEPVTTTAVSETSITAADKVDASSLWSFDSGFMVMNNQGTFNAISPDGEKVSFAVDTSLIDPWEVRRVKNVFDICFIPAYTEEDGNLKLTDIKLYDTEGNALVGDSCADVLQNIIDAVCTELNEQLDTAQRLEGSVDISALDANKWYAAETSVYLNNDTGNILKITEFSCCDDVVDIDSAESEYILAKDLMGDTVSLNVSQRIIITGDDNESKTATTYFSIRTVANTAAVISGFASDSGCILLSDVTTESYDTFGKDYIYNDTEEDITLSYAGDGEEAGTCTVKAGELLTFSWFDCDTIARAS